MVVDFPAPLGPKSEWTVPRSTVRETLSTARTFPKLTLTASSSKGWFGLVTIPQCSEVEVKNLGDPVFTGNYLGHNSVVE